MHKFTMIAVFAGVLLVAAVSFYFYTNKPELVLGVTSLEAPQMPQMPELSAIPLLVANTGKEYISSQLQIVGTAVSSAGATARGSVDSVFDKANGVFSLISPK